MGKGNKYVGIIWYGSLAAFFLVVNYFLHFPIFSKYLGEYIELIQRLSLGLALACIVYLIGKIIERVIHTQVNNEGDQYNLLRITKLLTLVFVVIVIASLLSQSFYSLLAGIGIISLVLGFALQSPITSFIAWLYIVFRRPYQVGHRIQIDGFKGDVVEINYIDTIIEEINGDYLGNDRRSGRLVYFPNSTLLRAQVINYSGSFGRFIWNETAIQISYTSDLEFVETCLIAAAEQDFKEKYPKNKSKRMTPEVYFRVNEFAWMEAVISYPVEPLDTTGRRNRILRLALPMLNEQPDKVGFPEGTRR